MERRNDSLAFKQTEREEQAGAHYERRCGTPLEWLESVPSVAG